jgi:hypothetical protein
MCITLIKHQSLQPCLSFGTSASFLDHSYSCYPCCHVCCLELRSTFFFVRLHVVIPSEDLETFRTRMRFASEMRLDVAYCVFTRREHCPALELFLDRTPKGPLPICKRCLFVFLIVRRGIRPFRYHLLVKSRNLKRAAGLRRACCGRVSWYWPIGGFGCRVRRTFLLMCL